MRNLLIVVLLAAVTPAAFAADEMVLANRYVRRTLVHDGHVWRTASVSRADGSDALKLQSDEFRILLMDGTALTVADYEAVGAPQVKRTGATQSVEIVYRPAGAATTAAPLSVTVDYALGDSPYLRKSLLLEMPANGAVDRLDVERFRTVAPADRGGRGEPVFLGTAWFCGLEYPGSETSQEKGLVALAHFPGLAKLEGGRWLIRGKTSVMGVGKPGDPLELAFSDYIDTIRRPSRSFLHYNSWYDLRGKEINPANLLAAYDGFKKNLLDPYGVKMDTFCPDDGYQDKQSIWVPRKDVYPDGFAPLARALEARGTRLGLWLPFNGTNLDVAWGAQQGYEKSNEGDYYCLVGPRYNAAIHDALARIIRDGNLNYMKHDFNNLRCSAPGHGHLPDDRHGHEANLNAELELMAFERRLQPDIFLNITSNVWFSPWWLQHADSIWMVADDSGYNKTWPQLSPREWDMSYRDHHLYGVYHDQRHLVPVSALMTHGIIHGRYNKLGGADETMREWSDEAVMYYGRGVQLKELYITPSLVPDAWWKPLGEATRWAVDNHDLLEQVIMVGGDPAKGEVHGYAHFKGDRGLIVLRNPDLAQHTIAVPFDKSVRYRGAAGRPFQARVVYPYVEPLPDPWRSGQPMRFTVPGATVMVYEIKPGSPLPTAAKAPAPLVEAHGSAAASSNGHDSKVSAQVHLPNEKMARCELILVVRSPSAAMGPQQAGPNLRLNGQAAAARSASGPGWSMDSVDVSRFAGQDVELTATWPTAQSQPFSGPPTTASVWLLADRPVADAAPPTGEHLPLAIAQGYRRQTVPIVFEARLATPLPRQHITADQLKTVKAAKLRLDLFGTNGEAQYRDKSIYLNGEKLARVPATGSDEWRTVVVDVPPEQLQQLRMENSLQLDNAGGDSYKFRGLALAVQLPDGTWVESSRSNQTYTSVAGWQYEEGKTFPNDRSEPVTVKFE